jgi:hypothetical protein
VLGQLFTEMTRARRKMRLLVGSAQLPMIAATVNDGAVSIRVVGEYQMVNMSELPVHLRRPHLLGYNFANRGFQFKIMPSLPAKIKDPLEEISTPPNGELVLISDKASTVRIERFPVRALPTFLWLETVELVRIGSRSVVN